jgi:hypothetical protein
MTKRFTTLAAFLVGFAVLVPATAFARTVTGHVTGFSPTSISVFDREVITVGFDNSTAFTKLVTQKPWQQDTVLTADALRVGNYVVVHVPDGTAVANWVQVATDFKYEAFAVTAQTAVAPVNTSVEAVRHRAEARAHRMAPNASESKRPGSPDTALHCDRMAEKLEKAGK